MFNGFKVLANLKLSNTYNNTTCINVFNYLASGLSSLDYEPRKIPLYPSVVIMSHIVAFS